MDKKGWREFSDDELILRDRLNDVEPHKGWVFTDYTEGVEMVHVELVTSFFSRNIFSRRYWEPEEGIRIIPHFDITFFAPHLRDGSVFGWNMQKDVLNPDELEYSLRYNFGNLRLSEGSPDFRSPYGEVMRKYLEETSKE